MAYTRTNWVNNLTKVNATNMNNIEDGINEALTAAATASSDASAAIGDLRSDMQREDGVLDTKIDNTKSSIEHDYQAADTALSGRIDTAESHTFVCSETSSGNVVIAFRST